jgi:ADP-heptose:LPS heptosyltransferase
MRTVLEHLARASGVAVIRLRSLGDCVLTTPALEILKTARPDLRVAVVVEPRFRAIFEGNPHADAILHPEPAAVRAWRPALCLNLHGGGRSALLSAASLARYRAGFSHFRFRFLYNVRIPRAQQILGEERTVHTAEHLAAAMFYLGAPRRGIPRARLYAAGSAAAERGAYAVLHPAASQPDKTWPAERFVEVAEHLRGALELEPVFIGGPGDDLSRFARYRTVAGAPLEEVKRLLAGAAVFVGNDSGPAHMAAAFGLPVVVIFGSSDPEIWRPWRTAAETLRGEPGIGSVTVRQVLDALARLRVAA